MFSYCGNFFSGIILCFVKCWVSILFSFVNCYWAFAFVVFCTSGPPYLHFVDGISKKVFEVFNSEMIVNQHIL